MIKKNFMLYNLSISLSYSFFKSYTILKMCWYFIDILTACDYYFCYYCYHYYCYYYYFNIINLVIVIIIIAVIIIFIILLYLAYLRPTLSQYYYLKRVNGKVTHKKFVRNLFGTINIFFKVSIF